MTFMAMRLRVKIWSFLFRGGGVQKRTYFRGSGQEKYSLQQGGGGQNFQFFLRTYFMDDS